MFQAPVVLRSKHILSACNIRRKSFLKYCMFWWRKCRRYFPKTRQIYSIRTKLLANINLLTCQFVIRRQMSPRSTKIARLYFRSPPSCVEHRLRRKSLGRRFCLHEKWNGRLDQTEEYATTTLLRNKDHGRQRQPELLCDWQRAGVPIRLHVRRGGVRVVRAVSPWQHKQGHAPARRQLPTHWDRPVEVYNKRAHYADIWLIIYYIF